MVPAIRDAGVTYACLWAALYLRFGGRPPSALRLNMVIIAPICVAPLLSLASARGLYLRMDALHEELWNVNETLLATPHARILRLAQRADRQNTTASFDATVDRLGVVASRGGSSVRDPLFEITGRPGGDGAGPTAAPARHARAARGDRVPIRRRAGRPRQRDAAGDARQRGAHAWHLYPVRLDLRYDRDAFIESLRADNIGASAHFIPVHAHTYCRQRSGYAP